MRTLRILIAAFVLAAVGATSATAAAGVDFTSPLKNIRCHGDSTAPAYVDCSIAQQRWPSQPARPQACQGVFHPHEFELSAGRVSVGRCGAARAYCATSCQTLAYGNSIDLGPIECTSSKTSGSAHNGGLACRYTQGKHARFHLAIEAYDIAGPTGAASPATASSGSSSDELLTAIRGGGTKTSAALLPLARGKVGGAGQVPDRPTGTVSTTTRAGESAIDPRAVTPFGFVEKPFPPIGRIWIMMNGKWQVWCSGTVVSRELVLTAAHCLTDDKGHRPYQGRIAFVPGQTWDKPNSQDPRDIRAPYQVWEARKWWTPSSYLTAHDPDWGLIQIQPHGAEYIGDVTGWQKIETGVSLQVGQRLWLAGYPSSGDWSTAKGHMGRGLFKCATAWQGRARLNDPAPNDIQYVADCTMNRGASGGPWLAQLSDGSWGIIGVTNWCDDDDHRNDTDTYCTPVSSRLRALEFDARFVSFWMSVNHQLG